MKGTNLGELEELILLSIASLHDNAYGISIQDYLAEQVGRKVSIGSLHSSVTRLEEKGLVSSAYGGSTNERGGRRKRYYAVTAAGKEVLSFTKSVRDQLWSSSGLSLKTDG